jgi:sugar lactone lactonase YvrE
VFVDILVYAAPRFSNGDSTELEIEMNQRIFAAAIVLAVGATCTASLVFPQTSAPIPALRPGEACNLSKFCGVPYEYVASTASQSVAASSAQLINGVAKQVGGHIGTGSCFGSPICAWSIGRETIDHPQHTPNMGYTYAYPLDFPAGSTGGVASVAMDSKGDIFAFLRNAPGKPMLFEWNSNHKLVKSFGVDIAGKPHGMAVDAEDNLWICDQFGDTVMKLSPEGELLMTLGVKGQRGDWDEAKGQRLLWQPMMLAFAANGDIYIAMGHGNESPNDGAARILHLDKNGRFINQWFGNAAGPGKFAMAHAIAINPHNGDVYIGDREEYRIVVYDGNGKFIKTIQMPNLVCALFVDRNERLWMATGQDGQVVKLDWDGNMVGAAGEGPGTGAGQFIESNYMVQDPQGNLFVGDTSATRVTELVASRR